MNQENQNRSTSYIHQKPESLPSKMVKLFFSLAGWKRSIEKDMTSGNINQEAAPFPKSFMNRFQIDSEAVMGRKVWTVRPKQNLSAKVILYLHGGAYIYNIQKVHWQFIEKLLKNTGVTIVVPDYPLAPQFISAQVFSFMHTVYDRLIANFPPDSISFMGDSAGAGLALALCQSLRNEGYTLPQQMLLLSPWLDISMRNPDIPAVDSHDKILGVRGLQLAGESYAGDLDLKDYRVSPLYGDFSQLPKLSIFIGTHDLFIADARKLKSKLEAENISFNYYEYPRMMHVWTIIPGLPEAIHSIGQIIKLINHTESDLISSPSSN
jgi:acetyl esterase/lipase